MSQAVTNQVMLSNMNFLCRARLSGLLAAGPALGGPQGTGGTAKPHKEGVQDPSEGPSADPSAPSQIPTGLSADAGAGSELNLAGINIPISLKNLPADSRSGVAKPQKPTDDDPSQPHGPSPKAGSEQTGSAGRQGAGSAEGRSGAADIAVGADAAKTGPSAQPASQKLPTQLDKTAPASAAGDVAMTEAPAREQTPAFKPHKKEKHKSKRSKHGSDSLSGGKPTPASGRSRMQQLQRRWQINQMSSSPFPSLRKSREAQHRLSLLQGPSSVARMTPNQPPPPAPLNRLLSRLSTSPAPCQLASWMWAPRATRAPSSSAASASPPAENPLPCTSTSRTSFSRSLRSKPLSPRCWPCQVCPVPPDAAQKQPEHPSPMHSDPKNALDRPQSGSQPRQPIVWATTAADPAQIQPQASRKFTADAQQALDRPSLSSSRQQQQYRQPVKVQKLLSSCSQISSLIPSSQMVANQVVTSQIRLPQLSAPRACQLSAARACQLSVGKVCHTASLCPAMRHPLACQTSGWGASSILQARGIAPDPPDLSVAARGALLYSGCL